MEVPAYERYLGIFICTVVVVLRPCSCLSWACTVVADNVWKQDGIGPSVDGVELRTDLVGHGVRNTEEGIGEGHTCDG